MQVGEEEEGERVMEVEDGVFSPPKAVQHGLEDGTGFTTGRDGRRTAT